MEEKYYSYDVNKFNIEFSNPFFGCKIFWARVVSSENESLFTQYTKHSFYEIQYALKGKIGMTVDKSTPLTVEESYFVIVPPDTYHQVVDADSEGARFIMAFSLDIKDKRLKKLNDALNSPVPCRESPHMKTLLSVILGKTYSADPLRRSSITSLVECFFLEVTEQLCPLYVTAKHTVTQSGSKQKVMEIEAFLHEYNGIGITVTDIAERFNMSERHISRLFNAERGYSAKDAINREKLKRIEFLAASTSLSLSEISELCGFCDEYAMNKFYRRINRINLSEFRKIGKPNR